MILRLAAKLTLHLKLSSRHLSFNLKHLPTVTLLDMAAGFLRILQRTDFRLIDRCLNRVARHLLKQSGLKMGQMQRQTSGIPFDQAVTYPLLAHVIHSLLVLQSPTAKLMVLYSWESDICRRLPAS